MPWLPASGIAGRQQNAGGHRHGGHGGVRRGGCPGAVRCVRIGRESDKIGVDRASGLRRQVSGFRKDNDFRADLILEIEKGALCSAQTKSRRGMMNSSLDRAQGRSRRSTNFRHFDLTWRCCFHCPHCYAGPTRERRGELTTAEALNLLDQMAAAGCLDLLFSGGDHCYGAILTASTAMPANAGCSSRCSPTRPRQRTHRRPFGRLCTRLR